MKEIELSQGKVTLVDDDDFEWLSRWIWFAAPRRDDFIASRNKPGKRDSERGVIVMHREIARARAHEQVDHINGITLDNRKENLRLCENAENNRNKRAYRTNKSGFKGVSKQKNKWRASIVIDGRQKHLGTFEIIENAARAYDAAAKKWHGEFANLNFP